MRAWQTGEALNTLPLAGQGLGKVRRQLLWLGRLTRMLQELALRSLVYSVLTFSESWGAQRVRLASKFLSELLARGVVFSIVLESREVQVITL
jgi:hypothetical protein